MRTQTLAMFGLMGFVIGCPAEKKSPPPTDTAPAAAATSKPAEAAASMPHEKMPDGPDGHPFSGLVKLDDGIAATDIKPSDVLFVMARESQGNGLAGRLVAVQRYGELKFPKRYQLGPDNVMVPGIPFTGPFIVTARLDRDGDPMTRGKDDLYATVAEPVRSGVKGVHLVLKRGKTDDVPAPDGVTPPPAPPKRKAIKPVSQPAQ